MPMFTKKPVTIEARQWDGTAESAVPIINWMIAGGCTATLFCADSKACTSGEHTIRIRTLEGDMDAAPFDWIIKGVKGEFYPCKNDIFDATYDPADMEEFMVDGQPVSRHAVPHEDKEHPATNTAVEVETKTAHNPDDANCVKHVQGEPSRPVECPVCTRPKVTHRVHR